MKEDEDLFEAREASKRIITTLLNCNMSNVKSYRTPRTIIMSATDREMSNLLN